MRSTRPSNCSTAVALLSVTAGPPVWKANSVAPVRGGSSDSHVTERVISQLLTEMDGLESLHNVVIIAATNRPDMIDPALLRPGRFDRMVSVGVPDLAARKDILKVHTRHKPLDKGVDLNTLAEKMDGYTGADISAVVNEAVMMAIREVVAEGAELTKERIGEMTLMKRHFDSALDHYRPRAKSDVSKFNKLVKDFEYVR